MKKAIYIVYAGSEAERHELDEMAEQIAESLLISGRQCEILCAYERAPKEWDLPRDTIVLMLDPYFETGEGIVDIREMLEVQGIRYSGPGPFATRMTADKVSCKRFLCTGGIPWIPDAICTSYVDLERFVLRQQSEGYVVKPVDKGGGLDVEYIHGADMGERIPLLLLSKYGRFMVEPYIRGTEISVPVIYDPVAKEIVAFPPVSITLHGYKVFNVEAKASNSAKTMAIPAKLPYSQEVNIRSFSISAYRRLKFNGLLRVDFMCGDEGIYFLEANSYPSLGRNFGICVPSARTLGFDQATIIEWLIETAQVNGVSEKEPGYAK